MNNTNTSSKYWPAIALIFGFILWIICFRGFILGKLSLTSDAIAYYEHIKFFVDALGRGVYPLWEPFRSQGVAFEFFLRRIGSFNPTYLILLVLAKTGIPFMKAYLAWLVIYYLIGMTGFYLLSKRLFENSLLALFSCLLLMFSSIGTRLFDSYILLTFIPMVWFFYFLVSFGQNPQRHTLLGITFCLMILVTTYIPFYFLIVLLTFIFTFALLYSSVLRGILSRSQLFFQQNRILSLACVTLFSISLIPGILFYQESEKGEVILLERHYNYDQPDILPPGHKDVTNMLEVDFKTVTSWGIEEDLMYSAAFDDARKFKFAIFYIPVWGILIFLLGLWTKINKRLIFLITWAAVLYLINTPHSPFYLFLYKHVFFFKYFRNLHFFLWLILLPIAVLFITEQFKILLGNFFKNPQERLLTHAANTVSHAAALFFVFYAGKPIVTTVLTIFLSYIFFLWRILSPKSPQQHITAFCLLGLIVLEPLGIYHYLNKNSEPGNSPFLYDNHYLWLDLPTKTEKEAMVKKQNFYYSQGEEFTIPFAETPSFYYGAAWFAYLREKINYRILADEYFSKKLLLYDNIEFINDTDLDFRKIENTLLINKNTALVSAKPYPWPSPNPVAVNPFAEIIDRNSPLVEVIAFDVNYVKLKTRLPTPKFLVYNDCYHSEWEAFINGKKTDVNRTNIAYKGLWIPAGENVVLLKFSSNLKYIFNITLLFIFYFTFLYLSFISIQDYQKEEHQISL